MTDKAKLKQVLDHFELGPWQYHTRVRSTNDLALSWANDGAPDGALVLADEQTAGRGRGTRRWVTRPGSALAMSLVLRPNLVEQGCIPRFTALAALGLIRALAGIGLQAVLKWPNDVLLKGKKIAGVLVEADWQGNRLDSLVVGMGVNVSPGSIPEPDQIRYPAASVVGELGKPVNRWELLGAILAEMRPLRDVLTSQAFMAAWNGFLAFRGEWVWFRKAGGENRQPRAVRILRVGSEGELIYEYEGGEEVSALAGEILMAYNQGED